MDLVKYLENPMPIKAIPEDLLQRIFFGQKGQKDKNTFVEWVSNLLSLYDRQSVDRLEYAVPAIIKLCWSMGMPEIIKMFEMYADNELGLQPRSNYFDRILVGNIFNAYKAIEKSRVVKKEVEPLEISEDDKRNYAYANCIISFDNYKQERIMDKSDWTVYDELDSRKLLDFTKKEKLEALEIVKEKYKKDFVERAKILLLERLYQKLITKGKHIKELL